jgi:histidine triad (HIT) family protein
MSECIFCKVASGEIPASVVYANDDVVAFDDISPQAPVHTLIVPRTHVAGLGDPAADADLLGRLMSAVPAVAEAKGIAESGYRVIINTGPDAGQTVFHLHVHVLGGGRFGPGMMPDE